MGPVTDAHKLTYQANVELAVQQKRAQLEPIFTYQSGLSGRQANVIELIGSTSAIVNGPRGGDTPNIDNQLEPVWVKPTQLEWGKVIEKEDAIKALTDYQSPFAQAGAAAIQRSRDDVFAAAIFGSRIIGQDGLTVVAWDNTGRLVGEGIGSADDVTVTGMNVKKLIRGKRLLQAAQIDIDAEELWCVLNAAEIEGLYRDITYVSKDYRSQAVLEGRQVLSILNVTIIPSEKLPNLDADTHRAAMGCKSGMIQGDFSPIMTRAEPNPAKKYRIHPYIETWMGATRTEDAKVVEILNKF
jgi:hypothetical protein